MGTEPSTKEFPKVIKLNKALKLAEAWVNNMSGSTTNEQSEQEFEGRPSRLGLGAKVAPKVKTATSTDPVERQLLGKLKAQKRLSTENPENTTSANEKGSDEDSEDEPESRISAFTKKRSSALTAPLQPIKKSK